ncbi:MAG: electron transfer flavoprotein subunit alpha/FixB family protein [Deltaproteobacteria bacterium]|nr:electron transfer flavoprotein subunit alpha/FixB family protein [Deltaproteobacteria bacterium]
MGDILVIAETYEGKLRKVTLSSIAFAKELAAKAGVGYGIAVLGKDVGDVAAEVAGFGAKAVYTVDDPALENYVAGTWAGAVAGLAEQVGADFVAATTSTFGRDLLPRVAARLNAGMVSDVMSVEGDAGDLKFKRPMWAGNVIGTVKVTTPKAVFSVRGTEFDPATPGDGASPIQAAQVTVADDGKVRYAGFAATVSERPDLTEASVVVAGGRGLKDKAGFDGIMNPLADLFGAAIGATRAVVDAGIAPNDLQVGQTGKVVAPDLYIAVALSGAIQHLAGMKNSKVIVAINKDEEAPVFSVADYGLVADAFKAVPEFIELVKKG